MRVIAYVVSGIGFLGAGVIMKQGMDVRGLNTAATLWASAAVGSCAGADMVAQAVALTVFVLAGNTMLRPLVNAINRIPLDERASEATYYFKLAVAPDALPDMRDRLVEKLENAKYPVADVDVVEHRRRFPGNRGNAGLNRSRSQRAQCGCASICSISRACAMPPGRSTPRTSAAFARERSPVARNIRRPAVDPANKFAVNDMAARRQARLQERSGVCDHAGRGGPCDFGRLVGADSGRQTDANGAGDPAAASLAPETQNKPAESKPGGERPTTPAPEPARPDAEAQKAGAQPVLPPAPAEKTAAADQGRSSRTG